MPLIEEICMYEHQAEESCDLFGQAGDSLTKLHDVLLRGSKAANITAYCLFII